MSRNNPKPWERGGSRSGTVAGRERRRVLILCEDAKSSCLYFQQFPFDPGRVEVRTVGTGRNTNSLVEEAIRQMAQAVQRGTRFNQVWCVFDRDSFPASNFNRALELARNHRIEVAWSNEAFELWYLLHFNYHDTGISRREYGRRLTKLLQTKYDKADAGIFGLLKSRQETAMRHARQLEKHWHELGGCVPEKHNPSTNVHRLVNVLNHLAELGPV